MKASTFAAHACLSCGKDRRQIRAEFEAMDEDVQDNLLAAAKAVQIAGPKAGRPHVDTLAGSKHKNMKELRFEARKRRKE